MTTEHITNAVIESADITFDRDIFLSAWLFLDYGGSGQGFGGYVLGADPFSKAKASHHADQPNIAGEFISSVMAVVGVTKWSALPGKVIRVIRTEPGLGGKIVGIGHPIKDRWYRPVAGDCFLEMRTNL